MILSSLPILTASVLLLASSLLKMLDTWDFTVVSAMKSLSAISLFEHPLAISWSTLYSWLLREVLFKSLLFFFSLTLKYLLKIIPSIKNSMPKTTNISFSWVPWTNNDHCWRRNNNMNRMDKLPNSRMAFFISSYWIIRPKYMAFFKNIENDNGIWKNFSLILQSAFHWPLCVFAFFRQCETWDFRAKFRHSSYFHWHLSDKRLSAFN